MAGCPSPDRVSSQRKRSTRLRQAASAAGRDFSTLSISVFGAPADEAVLAEYRELGIDRALLAIPDLTRDEIMRVLDKYAQ
jgi:alkanesulfonate monooxygenase SsuD/methylene tetrahydromethanopterin reductase-like flavin-dependent oxidoreductase (luciferase family)